MKYIILIGLLLLSFSAEATYPRSVAEKHAFIRANPCPVVHIKKYSCPGYVIDHIKPLACGGVDKPSNMQWQSVAEGKAKDKWELKGCKK